MSKLILEEQLEPTTPGLNKIAIYSKAGGGLYTKNDDGEEVKLNNLSDANAIDLTDGGVTTLHTHGASGMSWSLIATNTTASNLNGYLINATSNNVTLTMPSSPSEGDTVGMCDVYNKATTNTITISRNGENIEGLDEDLTLDVDGAGFILVYVDSTRGWELISEVGGPSLSINDYYTNMKKSFIL